MCDLAQSPQEVWQDHCWFPKTSLKNIFFSSIKTLSYVNVCFINWNPTYWSVTYYEAHHESCCISVVGHCALLCMNKDSEVLCPKWPKRPFYIQNLHQASELDQSLQDIHLQGHCSMLLLSSSIWCGKFWIYLWWKRVNMFRKKHECLGRIWIAN